MKRKAEELSGPALDYAVAKALPRFNFYMLKDCHYPDDHEWVYDDGLIKHFDEDQYNNTMSRRYDTTIFTPSTNWREGGEIIEREKIDLIFHHVGKEWTAIIWDFDKEAKEENMHIKGETALIAAMRCFVQYKFGKEVELPKEFFA